MSLKSNACISALLCLLMFSGCFARKGFVFEGKKRSYFVCLPKNIEPGDKVPLVLNLHGTPSNGWQQRWYSRFNKLAEREGFMVVYPNAIQKRWNARNVTEGEADDPAFLNALLDTLIQHYPVDTQSIYATGMSAGGFMTFTLACRISHRLAAIASVTGSMDVNTFTSCKPELPVPVLLIMGTTDPLVKFEGAEDKYVGAGEVVRFWMQHNQCSGYYWEEQIPNMEKKDKTKITKFTYQNCEEEVEVLFYRVEGGGTYLAG